MLSIPLITDYIQKAVKHQPVADSVDHLNYYFTSILLAVFALAISAKQYFGSPIQCFVPMEFRAGWEKYAEDYCFIQNSYYVPIDEPIPDAAGGGREDRISYYRWVPIMLALQALMFFAPNYFWNTFYKQTVIQPRTIIMDAMKCARLHGDERDSEVHNLAEYIGDIVANFSSNVVYRGRMAPRAGHNATLLYLCTKFFYLCNIFGQLYMLNHFLGSNFLAWGFESLREMSNGIEGDASAVFPRVIMCDFQIRRLGNLQRHTVQCVIMLNMINEKLYLFLWFWFLFVGICTLINFTYHLITFGIFRARTRVVLWNLSKRDIKMSGLTRVDLERFVSDYLYADGVLLLKFIGEHVGSRLSRDITRELIKLYAKQEGLSFDDESETKHDPSVCSNDKTPLTGNKVDKGYYGNFDKNIEPGVYAAHGGLYPIPTQMRGSPKTFESTAPPEEFIDDEAETLPIRAIARARAAQQQAPSAENVYGNPNIPANRQTTPTEV